MRERYSGSACRWPTGRKACWPRYDSDATSKPSHDCDPETRGPDRPSTQGEAMTVRGALVILVATLAYGCGRVDPVEELAAARVEVGNGDFQTAAIRISNVLRADPDNRDAHVLRGELALAVGDYPTAAA